MNGTVIYLHGAIDLGAGYVSAECQPGGTIWSACQAEGFALQRPDAGQAFPVAWHEPPLVEKVAALLQPDKGPFFLAGHSLGGRGALLIALRQVLGDKFKAAGAIAPALGVGRFDRLALARATPFRPPDLQAEAKASGLPLFLGFSPDDFVVGLQDAHFAGLDHPPARRVVRRYDGLAVPPDPHNALVAATANDLIHFFANLGRVRRRV